MIYKVRLEIYNNAGGLNSTSLSSHELTNPTVGTIKSLVNPGRYTNIKSETFSCDNRGNLNNNELITSPFIKYRIDLN